MGTDGVRENKRIIGSTVSMRPKCRCIQRNERAGCNQEKVTLEAGFQSRAVLSDDVF